MEALLAVAAAAPALPAPHAPPLQRLTEEERWTCVVLHKVKWKKKAIAEKLGVHRNTVRAVLARYRRFGKVGSGSRGGRPRCTDEALDTAVAVTARLQPFTSPRQLVRTLSLDCSPRTVDRRLQLAGLFGRVARHKRAYSEAERQKRLAFAEGYGAWTTEQWSRVLFSDEKCFYGKGFCGRMWVRREKGDALNPQYTVHRVAHPIKLNVWACFCGAGQGHSHIFNENMDAALMKSVLSNNLIASAKLHFSFDPPEQWYLLHDNDKKFTSHLVREWLHTAGITCIEFPPYSPDLNPIENLWAAMAREVEKHACDSMEALQDVLADEWDKVDAQLMRKLAESMPARCAAVIEAKGWHTKYYRTIRLNSNKIIPAAVRIFSYA